MQSKIISLAFAFLYASSITSLAQTTAFTYQGKLGDNGIPANGNYDMRFYLRDAVTLGIPIGPTNAFAPIVVSNGLFIVSLNFGASSFPGADRWLEIGVRTYGSVSAYTALTPRQAVNPTPYAIFANSASSFSGTLPAAQLSGTLNNSQLANNSITVSAGTGLGGGGLVALGNSTTLINTGVRTVTGSANITASTVNGAVTLGDTATSANTANAIVKRDGSGNFSAGGVNLSGPLNLTAANSLTVGGNQLVLADGGASTAQNVGIGVSIPQQKLHVAGNIQMDGVQFIAPAGFYLHAGGNVNIETPIFTTSDASVKTLTIRGGADLAEPFKISNKDIPKGSVVVIDEQNPGQLKLSERAYDKRVAGIVSGANGINPGILLTQEGFNSGGQSVALSGRVYVLANAPIQPGDFLTTSDVPGHAMKAKSINKAQGAIIGKAMTSLKAGQGMVLVLVTLQ